MTLVVPFDGSTLAEAALVRATAFGRVFDEDVLAVTVVPEGNVRYARERDWIGPDEAYETDAVVATLHTRVTDLCPSADFRHRLVDRHATSGTIAKALRRTARDESASMVFIGSDNAGHLVTEMSSVGGKVMTDDAYDVVIVRNTAPSRIARLRNATPDRRPKSDFYHPD